LSTSILEKSGADILQENIWSGAVSETLVNEANEVLNGFLPLGSVESDHPDLFDLRCGSGFGSGSRHDDA